MSEHEHGHHGHEPWKEKLSHAFKELKEADNDRDARLHHNKEAIERIFRDIFPPVINQFVKDAQEHGFHAEIKPRQGDNQTLELKGPTACTIIFRAGFTPQGASLSAQRVGGQITNLLQGKNPEQFHEADLGDYLAAQLLEIKPRKI